MIPLFLAKTSWGLCLPDVATFTADNCREDAKRRPAQLFGDKCRPNEERMKALTLMNEGATGCQPLLGF